MAYILHQLIPVARGLTNQDYVVIIGGTNDTSPDHARHVRSLLSHIVTTVSVNIVLTEIPLLLGVSPARRAQIMWSNRSLFECCMSNDIPMLLLNHIVRREHFVYNGLHFNFKGKTAMCSTLSVWLKGIVSCRNVSSLNDNCTANHKEGGSKPLN